MTYTRAIGVVFGAIIDRIVRWLALSRIHPNVLTFIGLVINAWAAFLLSAYEGTLLRARAAKDPRLGELFINELGPFGSKRLNVLGRREELLWISSGSW